MFSSVSLCVLCGFLRLCSLHTTGLIRQICVIPADSAVGFCPRVYAQSFPFHAAASRQLGPGSNAGDLFCPGDRGLSSGAYSNLLPARGRSSLRDDRRDDDEHRRGRLPRQQSMPDAAGIATRIFADRSARLALCPRWTSPASSGHRRCVAATRHADPIPSFPRPTSRI